MIWFIVGIILAAITLYVHKHSYERKVGDMYIDRLSCPLWLAILIFAVACIPFVGVILFSFGVFIYMINLIDPSPTMYFNADGIVKKIIDLLNKEV